MNKTRFYEILQAAKKGEDLKQFVPTNAPEAALINDLAGGNGGAEYVEDVVKVGPVEVGSTDDVYCDITAYTPEEIYEALNEAFMNNRGQYNILESEYVHIGITGESATAYTIYLTDLRGFENSGDTITIYSVEQYGGWNTKYFDFTKPIYADLKGITKVGNYNHLLERMFYIGKKESKLVANADITSEQLNDLNKVEVVTPTETKVIGGSTGGASMVPTYFKLNNPNITNMYYGMTIPTWNKVKIDVIKVLDAYTKKYHGGTTTFKDLCVYNQVRRLVNEMNSNGTPLLFKALLLNYSFDEEYGDSFNGANTGERFGIGVSLNNNDDNTYTVTFSFQQGMGSFPQVSVNIDAEGNPDQEVIEYDVSDIRTDGQLSGDVTPQVYVIYDIMELIDLNIFETFDAFSFE